jgi:hypothetical protein
MKTQNKEWQSNVEVVYAQSTTVPLDAVVQPIHTFEMKRAKSRLLPYGANFGEFNYLSKINISPRRLKSCWSEKSILLNI